MDIDILGAAGKGALSGAGTGATIGSVIPGVGTAVGAGVGAILGGTMAGMKQGKANNAQQIPMIDPIESARLAQLEQQRRSLMAGTDGVTQQNINDINNQAAASMNTISKNTAGDVSGTIDALLKSQNSAQNAINQSVVNASQRLPYFDTAAGTLLDKIADRRLYLERLKRGQVLAENAQARKEANVSGNAVASSGILNDITSSLAGLGGGANNATVSLTPEQTQGINMLSGMLNAGI